jgi:hypothetical protein
VLANVMHVDLGILHHRHWSLRSLVLELQLLAEARRLLVHNKIRKDSNRMADSLKRGAVIDDTRHSPEDSIDTKAIHLVDSQCSRHG